MNGKEAEGFTEFTVTMEQVRDFEFRVRFDNPDHAELAMDEPAPLGGDSAPSASRILAAAIGNCLSASFLFCCRKARAEVGPVRTSVRVRTARNEKGRLRIIGAEVEIDPGPAEGEKQKARRCLDLFEDYCVVTQSVRQGIPVKVTVKGFEGGTQAGGI